MRRRCSQFLPVAAALGLLCVVAAPAEAQQVNTIREAIERLGKCWRPPPVSLANPIDITVLVSFNRAGEILGHPRITYESEAASDNDRVQYRIAVMQALQRCMPMPFTEGMAAPSPAIRSGSGSPNRNLHPNPQRKEHG